jgi:uncharacterized membrane protein YphA (DoxX/SURF4 family)
MKTEKFAPSNPARTKKIFYWIITGILLVGMLAGGASQLFMVDYQVEVFKHLGYPLHLMTIIGAGKILAAIALIIPRFPWLKMWAYAGIFFVTVCAVISHAMAGDYGNMISPFFVAGLTVISCWLNPGIRFARIKAGENFVG